MVNLVASLLNARSERDFERGIGGLWLETFRPDEGSVGYGLIDISYSEEQDALHLEGTVFANGAEILASWRSVLVYVDRRTQSVMYVYEDDQLDGDGHGRLSFIANSAGDLTAGNGYFLDEHTSNKQARFDIDLLDPAYCNDRLGLPYPDRSTGRRSFIAALYARHTEGGDG